MFLANRINGLLVTLGFAFVLYKWTARLLEIESIIIFLGKSGSESARLTNEPSKPLQTKKQCDKNFTSHNVSFFHAARNNAVGKQCFLFYRAFLSNKRSTNIGKN